MDFVIFDRAPLEAAYPRNSHQMARHLAANHRVLFVEPPDVSLFSAIRHSSLRRNFLQRTTATGRPVRVGAALWKLPTYTTYPLHRQTAGLVRRDRVLLTCQLRQAFGILWLQQPVLWFYSIAMRRLVPHLPHRAVACSITDDIASFPHVNPAAMAALVQAEHELVRLADVVFCTSHDLAQRNVALNPRTYYLPNAAASELFATPQPVPADLAGIPHPWLGVFGTIASYKLDVDLLAFVARTHPEWSIVAIGEREEGDCAELPHLPNLHWLGGRPYSQIPAYQQAMDVLLIANLQNANTANSFPLRFFEHLATGKPVVSTPMPTLRAYTEHFRMATTPEQFVSAIATALADNRQDAATARQELALQHSWWQRANNAVAAILGYTARTPDLFCTPPALAISIVILTRRRPGFLQGCLDSLLPQLRDTDEVVVLDNSDDVRTQELLQKYPRVQYVRIPFGPSVLSLRNVGVERARGNLLAFLDDDVTLEPHWLEACLAAFEEPSVAAVGGRSIDRGEEHFDHGRGAPIGKILSNGQIADNFDCTIDGLAEVDTVRGNNWAVRRAAFESVGGFDIGWCHPVYEELDLQLRLRGAGYKIMFAPRMQVFHHRAPPERVLRSRGPLQLRFRNTRAMMHAYIRAYGFRPQSIASRFFWLGDTGWIPLLRQRSRLPLKYVLAGYCGKLAGLVAWLAHPKASGNRK